MNTPSEFEEMQNRARRESCMKLAYGILLYAYRDGDMFFLEGKDEKGQEDSETQEILDACLCILGDPDAVLKKCTEKTEENYKPSLEKTDAATLRKRLAADRDIIVRRRLNGDSAVTIAKYYNCDPSTILKILRKAGVSHYSSKGLSYKGVLNGYKYNFRSQLNNVQ